MYIIIMYMCHTQLMSIFALRLTVLDECGLHIHNESCNHASYNAHTAMHTFQLFFILKLCTPDHAYNVIIIIICKSFRHYDTVHSLPSLILVKLRMSIITNVSMRVCWFGALCACLHV